LGNVKVVFNDYKEPVSGGSGSEKYDLNVLSLLNYYPFGMGMPGMGYEAGGSRYGFNGMEKDDVIKGVGNSYDFGGRNLYSSRLGRFNSNDPFERNFAFISPLIFANNNPIANIDVDGKFGEHTKEAIKKWTSPEMQTAIKKLDYIDQIKINLVMTLEIVGAMARDYELDKSAAPLHDVDPSDNSTEANLESLGNAASNAAGGVIVGKVSKIVSKVKKPKTNKVKTKTPTNTPNNEGVIYIRTDKAGKLKPYVGQSKNSKRFKARKKEHDRNHPDSKFDFEPIDRGNKKGKFPTDLDKKEQKHLDRLGGPANKSNPDGKTSNKKNIIRKK